MLFQGWGTSLAWWANIDFDEETKIKICELLFDKKYLGLNIVRYNLGGGTNPDNPDLHMRPGGLMPCLKDSKSGPICLDNDKKQVYILREAILRGVNHIELFVNSPPWWLTKNKRTYSTNPGISNLSKDQYIDYVNFLNEVYCYFKERFPICSIEPFNEPSNPFWTRDNGQEGCFFGPFARRQIIKQLKKLNPSITISSADEFSAGFGILWECFCPSAAIDQVNIHSYKLNYKSWTLKMDDWNITRKLLRRLVKKRFWMSEYGCGESNDFYKSLQFGKHIIRDLRTLSPQAWIYWQAVEHYNGWGLLECNLKKPKHSPIIITAKYWIFMHFTKSLNEGDQYDVIKDNILYVHNPKTQKHIYIVINCSKSTLSFSPHIPNLQISNCIQTNQYFNYNSKILHNTLFLPSTITSVICKLCVQN